MKRRDIFEWDDIEAYDRDQFIELYVLDELDEAVDDLDLSSYTIEHLHQLIDNVIVHLNNYLKDGEVFEE
jgi:hypothetical protein